VNLIASWDIFPQSLRFFERFLPVIGSFSLGFSEKFFFSWKEGGSLMEYAHTEGSRRFWARTFDIFQTAPADLALVCFLRLSGP